MKKWILLILFLISVSAPSLVWAAGMNSPSYAWGDQVGWINFAVPTGNVQVSDTALSGYAWSDNFGWINLSPSTAGVFNNSGNLSGYAWGENIGWINFDGVTIDVATGEFGGYATTESLGTISFSCNNTSTCGQGSFAVNTLWRPPASTPGGGTGGGGGGVSPSASPSVVPSPSASLPTFPEPPMTPPDEDGGIFGDLLGLIKPFISKLFDKPLSSPLLPIEQAVPKEAPLAFRGMWELISRKEMGEFVFAPLPHSIGVLAQKFPELGKTFQAIGIQKLRDLEKLRGAQIALPGFSESVGLSGIALDLESSLAPPHGVPLASLSSDIKARIPSEVVFVKTGGELIDVSVSLAIDSKGNSQQKFRAITGKPLQLIVKPDKPVKTVKGYVVFKAKRPAGPSSGIPYSVLTASVMFSNPAFAQPQTKPIRVEEELVLIEFEYQVDENGVYYANIEAPLVDGEYEVITVMDYEDPNAGAKEIRMITVVDPEGYVYEKNDDKETRIPGAVVTIYWLNPATKEYELFPMDQYRQENPQITDLSGTYSFLVPEGMYYLKVGAPGYMEYQGKPFQVREDSGVHTNIELRTKYWWLAVLDWKTLALVVVIMMLLYNFYRDRIREKSK